MLARNIAHRWPLVCAKFLDRHENLPLQNSLSLSSDLIIEHFMLRPATTRTHRSSDHDCSPSMPAHQENAKKRGRYRRQICCPYHDSRSRTDSDRPLLYARRSHESARDEPGHGSGCRLPLTERSIPRYRVAIHSYRLIITRINYRRLPAKVRRKFNSRILPF